jgi:hypothetical protein
MKNRVSPEQEEQAADHQATQEFYQSVILNGLSSSPEDPLLLKSTEKQQQYLIQQYLQLFSHPSSSSSASSPSSSASSSSSFLDQSVLSQAAEHFVTKHSLFMESLALSGLSDTSFVTVTALSPSIEWTFLP